MVLESCPKQAEGIMLARNVGVFHSPDQRNDDPNSARPSSHLSRAQIGSMPLKTQLRKRYRAALI